MKAGRASIFFMGVILVLMSACQNGRDSKPAPNVPEQTPAPASQNLCNHKGHCLGNAEIEGLKTVFERRSLEAKPARAQLDEGEMPATDKLRIDAVLLSEAYSEVFQLDILDEPTKFTLTLLNKMNEGTNL